MLHDEVPRHEQIYLALLLLAATRLIAQPAGAPSGPQLWRNIGPDRGGRSLTIAGSSARPNEYYFGAVGGGVWKTGESGAK